MIRFCLAKNLRDLSFRALKEKPKKERAKKKPEATGKLVGFKAPSLTKGCLGFCVWFETLIMFCQFSGLANLVINRFLVFPAKKTFCGFLFNFL